MNTFTAIESRVTAAKLGEPAPTREQITKLLEAAARAPDHGRLSPWRFIVIEGTARQRFAQILVDYKQRHAPDCEPRILEAERAKAMRAPTIIVVAAHVVAHPKVPEIEQILAVGAAVQNLLLAAQDLGFGSMWKTGAPAYDTVVKGALGLEPQDHIVGFVYLGTPTADIAPRISELSGRVTWW